MSYSIDDTQPGSPFEGDLSAMKPTIHPDEESSRRGGCLMNGLVVVVIVLVALTIVGLSAAAGWTSGQRIANTNATATQNFYVNEQLQHIPSDLAEGNLAMVDIRLRWLATQTPGVPGIGDFMGTATAAYQNSLPTATPTATATPESTDELESTAEVTEFSITQEASGSYDLVALLDQAENAVLTSQWQEAIDYLDVIMGVDRDFERTRVRTLMSQALNSYAQQLYNSGQPAAANMIVARARDFGPLAEGLEYESIAAELYLTARAAVGSGSPAAINAVQQLINLGPGRYYDEAQTMLYDFYVNSGDAYLAQGDSCSAVGQYQNAINLNGSGVANGKLTVAENACANATPTTDPNLVIPADGTVAPVGQVAPPGQ